MAYRDVLFAPLTSVFLLGGLTDATTAALPRAFEVVVAGRRAARRRWPGSALVARYVDDRRLPAAVQRNLHRASDSLTDAELIAVAHEHGLDGLPVALTVTPTRVAVAFAHAVFDGSGSLELLHDLLDAAAGEDLPAEGTAARLPVLQALRRVRRADARAFVDARRHRPAGVPSSRQEGTPPQSIAFALDSADLAALRRYREPQRAGRATTHSRIASVLVAALGEVERGDADVPVWMTTDLRHLARGRVEGNFIGRELIGTLHGDQWAPGALAARLVRMKGPGQALSLVWSTTGWLLRSAIGRRPAAGEEVVLTLATTQRTFPVPVGRAVATSVGGSPTFAFAWQSRGAIHVSVHCASGRFELGRFEEVFRRIVAERAHG